MQYTKPPLSFNKQAELLLRRGLQAEKSELISRLESVNYYRLSAYLFPFRQESSDTFIANTTLEKVWKSYTFDRQLRILIMDAIERIEVAARTRLVYCFAHKYGAFEYLTPFCLPNLERDKYNRWIDDMKNEVERSRETFVKHFQTKYGDNHDMPPLWMLCEVMSFGKMLTLFNGVDNEIQRMIAREYDIEDKILKSWLGSLNVIRNICAHHGRLWNRVLGFKPLIPRRKKYPQWHSPVKIKNNRIFGILTILRYLLEKVAPTSKWENRFRDLLRRYPDIQIKKMGFPENWEDSPIWKMRS